MYSIFTIAKNMHVKIKVKVKVGKCISLQHLGYQRFGQNNTAGLNGFIDRITLYC